MTENSVIEQTIKDLSWHCSSWKCHLHMNTKAYDSKLDTFSAPTCTDIFNLTEKCMRSPNTRWFFSDYEYPSYSLQDVVAQVQSRSLDSGSPLVVRAHYKGSCSLQCKFHRIHRGKMLSSNQLYEEGTRSTVPINNKQTCSRGYAGMKANRKASINRMTNVLSCCSVRLSISFCESKKGYFIKPGFGSNEHRNHPPSTSGKDCTYHSSSQLESNNNHGYLNNLMTKVISGTSAAKMMMGSEPNRQVHVSRHQALYDKILRTNN